MGAAAERRQFLLPRWKHRRARLRFPLRPLGLLHLEIIQERLFEREFNLNLIATAPSVIYKIKLRTGQNLEIHNPVDMPDPNYIEEMQEPWIEATILTPDGYNLLALCSSSARTAAADKKNSPMWATARW